MQLSEDGVRWIECCRWNNAFLWFLSFETHANCSTTDYCQSLITCCN